MGKESLVKKIFCNLGENNHPTYAVMTIALFKGILRPTFTMMDKKQDPESKKYAAFREGVTEAIAFPSYFLFGKLADKLAPKFLDETKLGIEGKSLERFNEAIKKPHKEVKEAIKALKSEGNTFKKAITQYKIVGETSSFVGVCIAAVFIIPAMCNIVLPPIMKGFKKWQDSKKQTIVQPQNLNVNSVPLKNDLSPQAPKLNKPNPMETYLMTKNSTGMRVGN